MALALTAVHQAAENLLTCVCQDLARLPTELPGLDGCPCRMFVAPGQPAADGCDEGCVTLPADQYPGQLTVHVIRIYATDRQTFPRETGTTATIRDNRDCAPPPTTAVELAVTLWRCTPLPTDQGCPPTAAQLGDSAMQLHADLLSVQRAILCCYADTDTTRPRGRRYVMGNSRTLGPQGGCVGLEQRVVVALDDCLACEPVAP